MIENNEAYSKMVIKMLEAAVNSYTPIIISGKQSTGKTTLAELVQKMSKSRTVVEITEERIEDIIQKDSLPIIVANMGVDYENIKDLDYIGIKCFKTHSGRYQQHFIPIERDKKAYDRLSLSTRVLAIGNSDDLSLKFSYLESRRIKTVEVNGAPSLIQLREILRVREAYRKTLSFDTIPPIHVAFNMSNKEVMEFFVSEEYKTLPSVFRENYYVTMHSKSKESWFPYEVAEYVMTSNSYLQLRDTL